MRGPVQYMYDLSPQPKQIRSYPGKSHSLLILIAAATGDDAMQRLIAFLNVHAAAAG